MSDVTNQGLVGEQYHRVCKDLWDVLKDHPRRGSAADVWELAVIAIGESKSVKSEVASVLQLMDGLAEQWGDEAVFRRCRDRLREVTK